MGLRGCTFSVLKAFLIGYRQKKLRCVQYFLKCPVEQCSPMQEDTTKRMLPVFSVHSFLMQIPNRYITTPQPSSGCPWFLISPTFFVILLSIMPPIAVRFQTPCLHKAKPLSSNTMHNLTVYHSSFCTFSPIQWPQTSCNVHRHLLWLPPESCSYSFPHLPTVQATISHSCHCTQWHPLAPHTPIPPPNPLNLHAPPFITHHPKPQLPWGKCPKQLLLSTPQNRSRLWLPQRPWPLGLL